MKRRLAAVLIVLALCSLFTAGCTASLAQPEETATPVATATPAPTPQPTPEPTPAPPVTPQDMPAYFMPGLEEIGMVPTSEYVIGIIAAGAADAQAWKIETDAMAEKYMQRFGVTVMAETAFDAQIAQSKAQDMLAQGVDFLIFTASDGETEISDMCEAAGVPYITMDGTAGKTPGENGYVCAILHDDYLDGVLTGLSIVEAMRAQYGEVRGSVGEIVPAADDLSAQLKSMGIRCVFSQYENLNVVISILGGTSDESRYKAATNVLKAFRSGELDAVIAMDEQTALQTLQAVLDTDRSELVGRIWSMNAGKDGLTAVWHGQFAQTIEYTSQTGLIALEYAIQHLEGNTAIPPVTAAVSRVFTAKSQEQKDAIALIISGMNAADTSTLFESMGVFAPFAPDVQALETVYPMHYFEYDDASQFFNEYMPFTTGEPVYTQAESE